MRWNPVRLSGENLCCGRKRRKCGCVEGVGKKWKNGNGPLWSLWMSHRVSFSALEDASKNKLKMELNLGRMTSGHCPGLSIVVYGIQ